MKIDKCPFCDCEEYFTNDYFSGRGVFYRRFDGREPEDNSQMYSGMQHKQGKIAYCAKCRQRLGSVSEINS